MYLELCHFTRELRQSFPKTAVYLSSKFYFFLSNLIWIYTIYCFSKGSSHFLKSYLLHEISLSKQK